VKRLACAGVLVLLLVMAFLFGSWHGYRNHPKAAGNRTVLYYVDPMNPAHTSSEPGIAPCGMKMEPVYADRGGPLPSEAGTESLPPGSVRISPEKQQLLGVTVGRAEIAPVDFILRTTGRVEADETKTYRINAATDGWIVDAPPVRVGSLVKKNERLAVFYSPEFVGAQQAYLYALGSLDRFQATGKETQTQIDLTRANIRQYRDSLRNLGMGEVQLEEIARTRIYSERIEIGSPAPGFVLLRNVAPGLRFEKGTEFFRIADLSRVWVVADLFQKESEYAKAGMKVEVSAPHQGRVYTAKLSRILPQFDRTSRTLKVGMEVDNGDYLLRPDMFVDVKLPVRLPPALTVPSGAVLDSGAKKTVFVDRGNGFFEPRFVKTGWRLGDRIEITGGLAPGEHVVTSGNFLIDSESRMKTARPSTEAPGAAPTVRQARDPVCGMTVDIGAAVTAGRTSRFGGDAYHFCSDECRTAFEKDPRIFVKKEHDGTTHMFGLSQSGLPPRSRRGEAVGMADD
jgi:RND family efflux transporter MFP subunit